MSSLQLQTEQSIPLHPCTKMNQTLFHRLIEPRFYMSNCSSYKLCVYTGELGVGAVNICPVNTCLQSIQNAY